MAKWHFNKSEILCDKQRRPIFGDKQFQQFLRHFYKINAVVSLLHFSVSQKNTLAIPSVIEKFYSKKNLKNNQAENEGVKWKATGYIISTYSVPDGANGGEFE